jgi:hypothetical protein
MSVTAKIGEIDLDAKTARVDLTTTFEGATVLGKAQVRVAWA